MTDQSAKTKGDDNPPHQQQQQAAVAIEEKQATSLLAKIFYEALAYVTCTKRRTMLNPMVCFAIILILGISGSSLIGLYRRDAERRLLRPLNVTIMAFPPVILYFLLSSVYIDPAVSDDEMAKFLERNPSVKKSLRFCGKCNKYKPYRASHCSFCRKCVIRRDHHCPWINNCVSFFNHKQFILFLVVTTIGLSVNVIVLYSNFRAFAGSSRNDKPTLSSIEMISFMSGIFAFSLLLVLPLILSQQIYAVVKNCAACEEYDLERVNSYLHHKKMPSMSNIYNVDLKTNIMQIWNASSHNGIVFPTIKGFSNNQFSKCARSIDDHNCESVTRLPHCTVTTAKYDGSLFIRNQIMATLFNPKFYSNVLTCEQGEVIYLKQPTLGSRWTKCYKLLSFETGNIAAEGFLPTFVLKDPADN